MKLRGEIPALEWVASGTGLLLTLGVLGIIGWEAAKPGSDAPPAVHVAVERIAPAGQGYVAALVARNAAPATAAAVAIEGRLLGPGGMVAEAAHATIDYVPGESERRAGLYFAQDPRRFRLDVRAVGYEEP